MESYSRYSYERESNVDRTMQSRYRGGEVLRFAEHEAQEQLSPKAVEDATQEDDGESTFSYVA